MVNENVIAPLEQSLRQIQQTLSQRENRLREIQRESNILHEEIETLKQSAEQIKVTMRIFLDGGAGTSARKSISSRAQHELEMEMNDYDYDGYDVEDTPRNRYPVKKPNNNFQQPNNNYQSRPVVSLNRGSAKQDVPAINSDPQVRSYRFRDRTITQACAVLMREANRPLHVNEIYNRLLENGMSFTGNNPTISIAVSLNRNQRFRKVAPGTFDLNIREATAS